MASHVFDTFEVKSAKKVDAQKLVLSEDQQVAYDQISKWATKPRGVLTLGGYAGSGKTQLLAKLIEDLGSDRFSCATFTGKAANVLSQKLKDTVVTTIHSMIYRPFEKLDGTIAFAKKMDEEAEIESTIVIDEASMVDERVLEDLKSFRRPILAIGDHGQLPPISGPSVLMQEPDLRLEKIHRQAEGSPIIQLSKTIRETGRVPMPPPKGIRLVSWGMFQGELQERVPSMTPEELNDFVVLCYKNATRVKVNRLVREARFGLGVQDDRPMDGDMLVCLRNQPPIYNGMRGMLDKVEYKKGVADQMTVRFPDDGILHKGPVVRAQFGRESTFSTVKDLLEAGVKGAVKDVRELGAYYDYGYCLTTHKAQGSGFRTVYWIRERSRADEDTYKRWQYTSATRAIDELVIVAA